jgi:hypothetical protein
MDPNPGGDGISVVRSPGSSASTIEGVLCWYSSRALRGSRRGFSVPAGSRVAVFVGGRRWRGLPASVPLARHSEIVLEVGPYVPPHASYTFPPGM